MAPSSAWACIRCPDRLRAAPQRRPPTTFSVLDYTLLHRLSLSFRCAALDGIRVGKMVLWSYLLGCAGPALTAACAMTYKDPFVLPMNPVERKNAKSAKIALAQVLPP